MLNFIKRYKWRIMIVTLLTPVVFLFLWREYRVWSIPDIGEPFDVAAFLEGYRDPEQNAMLDFLKAEELLFSYEDLSYAGVEEDARHYQKHYEDESYIGYEFLEPDLIAAQHDWKFANRFMQQYLKANLPALELYLKAYGKNHVLLTVPDGVDLEPGVQTYAEKEAGIIFGSPTPLRSLLPFLLLRASQLAHEGKHDEALDIFKGIHDAERQMRTGEFSDAFNGALFCTKADTQLFSYLSHENLTGPQLKQFFTELNEIHSQVSLPSVQIKWEYFLGRNLFASLLENSGYVGRFYQYSNEEKCLCKIQSLWIHHLWDYCDLPAWERPRMETHQLSPVNPAQKKVFDLEEQERNLLHYPVEGNLSHNGVEYSVAELIESAESVVFPDMMFMSIPQMLKPGGPYDRIEAKRQALFTAILLQIYHREEGEVPEKVADLIPRFVEKLPGDPFNQGQPFKYRQSEEGAIIWSLGPNGTDEGGRNKFNEPFACYPFDDTFFPVLTPGTPYKRPPVTAEKWHPEAGVYRIGSW